MLTDEEKRMIEETESFMREVYADPEVRDAEPPADMFERIMEAIKKTPTQ